MWKRLLLVALFSLTATGCASEQGNPRPADVALVLRDPFDALEGKWEGHWEWDVYSRGRGKEDLTLVITRVTGTGSSRDVYGTMTQMGGLGNAPVSGTAEFSGDTIVVRLSTYTGKRVTLTLRGDLLQGDGKDAPGPASLHAPHRVLLKRVDRPNPEVLFRPSHGALVATLPAERQITEVQSLAGSWTRLDRAADGGATHLFIYTNGNVSLLFGGDFYPLQTRLEGGKISWMNESRNGTMTLYEGNGKRVLRMVTGDSMITDYVFDGR